MGGVDLFSTKHAGSDKKFVNAIDKQLYSQHQESLHLQQMGGGGLSDSEMGGMSSSVSPPQSVALLSPPKEETVRGAYALSASPFGPLDQSASRRAFAYLVSVLNATYPDHDFSSLQPSDFKRESSCTKVMYAIHNILLSLGKPVPPRMWEYLDKMMQLRHCAIYSHTPPDSFLADEPGVMWSVMYFFFNKKRSRVAHIHIKSVRHHHHHSPVLTSIDPSSSRPRRGTRSSLDDYDDNDNDYDLTYSSEASFDEAMEEYNDDAQGDDRDDRDDDEVVGGLEMDD